MKKIYTFITIVFLLISVSIFAQTPPPPNNGNTNDSGGAPVGGGAPIGGGIGILMVMAVLYGSIKQIKKQ